MVLSATIRTSHSVVLCLWCVFSSVAGVKMTLYTVYIYCRVLWWTSWCHFVSDVSGAIGCLYSVYAECRLSLCISHVYLLCDCVTLVLQVRLSVWILLFSDTAGSVHAGCFRSVCVHKYLVWCVRDRCLSLFFIYLCFSLLWYGMIWFCMCSHVCLLDMLYACMYRYSMYGDGNHDNSTLEVWVLVAAPSYSLSVSLQTDIS